MEFIDDSKQEEIKFKKINDWNMNPDDPNLKHIQEDMILAKIYMLKFIKKMVVKYGFNYCVSRCKVSYQYLYMITHELFEPNVEKLFKLCIGIEKGVNLYAESEPKKRGRPRKYIEKTPRSLTKHGKNAGRKHKIPIDPDF